MAWMREETAPEGETVMTCQYLGSPALGVPVPMFMQKRNDVWYWMPDGIPSSVVPTHWQPLLENPTD